MMRASGFNQSSVAITGGTMANVARSGGTIDNAVIGSVTPNSAAFTTLTSTGVTALKGSITNDNALAGNIGELITATVTSGAPVALSNGAAANITSINLTSGDWDVSGVIDYSLTGVTGTFFQSGISMVSAALPTQAGGGGLGTDALMLVPLITTVLSANFGMGIPPVRVSLNTAAPVFLVAQQSFTVGSSAAFGTIRARRAR